MAHSHHAIDAGTATEGYVIRWAKFYDPLVNVMTLGRATKLRRQSVALAAIQPGDTLLDIGCGTGDLTIEAWRQVGPNGAIVGIDPAPEMIAAAQAKAEKIHASIDFRVGVIEALPQANQSVDVVLSSLMMHHLPAATQQTGLAEIYRVLRPGGWLLIVDFKRPTSTVGRTTITALLHGGLQLGIQDLVKDVAAAGFSIKAQGNMAFRPVGYLLAEKPLSDLTEMRAS